MKKLIKSVAVLLAAALAVGSLVGCADKPKESGDKFGVVGDGDSALTNPKGTVVLELRDENPKIPAKFKAAIDWFCWTEGTTKLRGPVVDKVVVKQDGKVWDKTNLPYGHTYVFEFPNNKDEKHNYIFYMYQKKTGNINPDDTDVAGVVRVYNGKPSKIYLEDSHWTLVPQQGSFGITENEPLDSFFPNGDYTITEVWPLVKVEGKKHAVKEDLKYDLSKETGLNMPIVQGSTKYFLFPANKPTEKTLITTFQPNRGLNGVNAQSVYSKKNKKGEITGVSTDIKNLKPLKDGEYFVDGETKHSITSEEVAFKETEYWGIEVAIPAHGKVGPTNSKEFNKMFYRASKDFNYDHDSPKAAALGLSYYEVLDGDPADK